MHQQQQAGAYEILLAGSDSPACETLFQPGKHLQLTGGESHVTTDARQRFALLRLAGLLCRGLRGCPGKPPAFEFVGGSVDGVIAGKGGG
jgi:hypothetical protein